MQSRHNNGNYVVRLDDIDNLLVINGNIVSEYYKNKNEDCMLIECDIDKQTIKVYWNGEDLLAIYPELVIESDIVDINENGTRFEGKSIGHVPCGYDFLYNEYNQLIYEGFFLDTKKMSIILLELSNILDIFIMV